MVSGIGFHLYNSIQLIAQEEYRKEFVMKCINNKCISKNVDAMRQYPLKGEEHGYYAEYRNLTGIFKGYDVFGSIYRYFEFYQSSP